MVLGQLTLDAGTMDGMRQRRGFRFRAHPDIPEDPEDRLGVRTGMAIKSSMTAYGIP